MTWSPQIVELVGYFTSASNAAFLAVTEAGEQVVYKPAAGERPLWDFPPATLAAREYLTYRVDRALGAGLVPETVLGDGPHGPGAIQRYVEADREYDFVVLVERGDPALWPVAVLDLVTNNADRKVGHLLWEQPGGRVRSIDHGLTFHPEDKLRTVLWAFGGRTIPTGLQTSLRALADALDSGLGDEIGALVGDDAGRAIRRRVGALLARPIHPLPPTDRRAVPWPPF